MYKGFWNYTEPVEYRVIYVKLLPLGEGAPPLHWQHEMAGQNCQAVEVTYKGKEPFLIFNDDGSGFSKMTRLGGPDSYSAHIAEYEFISEVPDEKAVKRFVPETYNLHRKAYNKWAMENHPVEFERLKSLEKTMKQFEEDRAFRNAARNPLN